MKRSGSVYVNEILAGTIEQREDEFIFTYESLYLEKSGNKPVSLTLPLRKEPYVSKTLFPFFDGLIPEGWLLNIATRNWKINANDRMGLLLAVCRDCVGAVHVESK